MERLTVITQLDGGVLTIEVRNGMSPPFTLSVTWDEKLRVAGAIAAGMTAVVQYLRQQRR